jgi:hypothetical protein
MARSTGLSKVAEAAAKRTTAIIQALMLDDTATYTVPIVFPLLVPAMVMYLTRVKSDDPAERHIGTKTFEVYSEYFAALEHDYPAASVVRKMFQAAQEVVLGKECSQDQENDGVQQSSIDSTISGWDLDWLGQESSSYPSEIKYTSYFETG